MSATIRSSALRYASPCTDADPDRSMLIPIGISPLVPPPPSLAAQPVAAMTRPLSTAIVPIRGRFIASTLSHNRVLDYRRGTLAAYVRNRTDLHGGGVLLRFLAFSGGVTELSQSSPAALPDHLPSRRIGSIAITSRPLAVYRDMFDLTDDDLRAGPILDCPGGASSFGAEVRGLGGKVVSADPLYVYPPELLAGRVRDDRDRA